MPDYNSDIDYKTLQTWSFISDYERHRAKFLELAVFTYEEVYTIIQSTLVPEDCIDVYKVILMRAYLFNELVQKKQTISIDYQEQYAAMFARYVLNKEWSIIEARSSVRRSRKQKGNELPTRELNELPTRELNEQPTRELNELPTRELNELPTRNVNAVAVRIVSPDDANR